MIRRYLAALALAILVPAATAGHAAEPGAATAEEVVAKVKAAAAELQDGGDAALARFRGKDSAHVWKDSYVFVSDCGQGILVAHPFQPEREGQKIAAGPAYGGVTAAEREQAQCSAAERPGGGWYAYPFPKPGADGTARKISYLLAVPGRPWIVGAGIYDQDTPLDQLERLSHGQ
jgi:signal transduction histidine kinase